MSNLSKPVFDEFELQNLMDIEVEIQERPDSGQRVHGFLALCFQFLAALTDEASCWLKSFTVLMASSRLTFWERPPCLTVRLSVRLLSEAIPIGIDLDIRTKLCHCL